MYITSTGKEVAILPNQIAMVTVENDYYSIQLLDSFAIRIEIDSNSTALYEWFKAKCKAQLTNVSPNEELLKKVQNSIPQMQEMLAKLAKK